MMQWSLTKHHFSAGSKQKNKLEKQSRKASARRVATKNLADIEDTDNLDPLSSEPNKVERIKTLLK